MWTALAVSVALSRGSARMCALPPGAHPTDVWPAAAPIRELLNAEAWLACDMKLRVCGVLGEGRFGTVLLGEGESGDVAVKVAQCPLAGLEREAAVLRAMQGAIGFPALIHYEETCSLLVMERLGLSLQQIWETESCSTHLPASYVLRVGRDALRRLRQLHHAGYAHNDMKPANLLLGAEGGSREAELHLIDFGLASALGADNMRETDGPNEAVFSSQGGGSKVERVGTPMYASIAAHEGRRTRAVDDVESLVYCLAFLAAGHLPWERKPHSRALFWKRKMVTDGCEVLTDSCAAERLTEEIHSTEAAMALQALWAQVVECHSTAAAVDYEACLAALGDD